MRGATRWSGIRSYQNHFNPRAPCGARLSIECCPPSKLSISIHAPHAGRDDHDRRVPRPLRDFNPRAPCGARHALPPYPVQLAVISIHAPHAGRDFLLPVVRGRRVYFNPRAPCGARPFGNEVMLPVGFISIHAPHAGRDTLWIGSAIRFSLFQSTRPMRGATTSITVIITTPNNFNPRAPCGARQQK